MPSGSLSLLLGGAVLGDFGDALGETTTRRSGLAQVGDSIDLVAREDENDEEELLCVFVRVVRGGALATFVSTMDLTLVLTFVLLLFGDNTGPA